MQGLGVIDRQGHPPRLCQNRRVYRWHDAHRSLVVKSRKTTRRRQLKAEQVAPAAWVAVQAIDGLCDRIAIDGVCDRIAIDSFQKPNISSTKGRTNFIGPPFHLSAVRGR